MQTIKIGDKVNWRGSWGKEIAKEVTVKTIEWVEGGKGKYGIPKDEILIPAKDWCIFGFEENNHWAYGHQIDLIKSNQLTTEALNQSK
jgi:hypothetical protein